MGKNRLAYAGVALVLSSILAPLGCNLQQQLALVQVGSNALQNLPQAVGQLEPLLNGGLAGQNGGIQDAWNQGQPAQAGYQYPAGQYQQPNPAYGNPQTPAWNGWQPPAQTVQATGGGWTQPAQSWNGQPGPTAQPASFNNAAAPTILIGSFNIQVLGRAKLSNPDVAGILVDIAGRFDVLAIQELRSTEQGLIPWFVQQINARGHNYQYIVGPRQGYTTSQEQYVYLFDANKLSVLSQPYTVPDPQGTMHRSPLVAHFQCRELAAQQAFSFVLLNLHTDPDVVPAELAALAAFMPVVRQNHPGEDDFILLGDFNAWPEVFAGYQLQPAQLALIPDQWPTNTRKDRNYDNFVIDHYATAEATGRRGVLDVAQVYGLSLDQALQVSDHLPVWAEFTVQEKRLQTASATMPGF